MQVDRFDIPGFREAVQQESAWRDAPFLELTSSICGIEIQQMTPRHLLILDGIGSPVLMREPSSLLDIVYFLWVLSPGFEVGNRRKEKKFGKRCRKLDGLKAIIEIRSYLERTFFDAPGGASGGKSWGHMSWCAQIINSIASEYGWTRSEIMNCPLRILHQLRNCIVQKKNPDAIISSQKTSALIGDHIALKQQQLRLVNLLAMKARQN